MGRRVITTIQFVDDLSGEELSERSVQTIRFGWEGSTYEIDLGPGNARTMHTTFERYANAGRKLATKTNGGTTKAAAERKRREIRDWATQQGIDQPRTGKIKSTTYDAWDAAFPNDPAPRPS